MPIVEGTQPARMSEVKQTKMRRSKVRASPRVNKTLKQLDLYKAIAQKFANPNDRYVGFHRS